MLFGFLKLRMVIAKWEKRKLQTYILSKPIVNHMLDVEEKEMKNF
jgi:hypothetical protein